MEPVIIAVIGTPGTGKSFLVERLAKKLGAVPIFEEVGGIPSRIEVNLKYNLRSVETILWFRNKLIRDMMRAVDIKKKGKVVVMDTCPVSNDLYIPSMTHGFEQEVLLEQARIDTKAMPQPDVVIFLDASVETIRELIRRRGRDYDTSQDFMKRNLEIKKTHDDYFKKNKGSLVYVNRDGLDFNKKEDVEMVVEKIGKGLNNLEFVF